MKTRTLRLALGVLLPFALVAAACGDDEEAETTDTTAASSDTTPASEPAGDGCASVEAPDGAPEITIGAQDFGESAILAEIYAQCLEAAGFTVSIQELGGFRDLELEAFDAGDINFAPEYAASMLENLNGDASEATADADETTDLLEGYLADRGLMAFEPSEAEDTNAFVVTQETSDELGLTAISDLADHTDLVLGAPADCETNPFCLPGLQRVYGIDLTANYIALEPAAVVEALTAGEIDVALLFSTDSRIATNDWVLLEDDQQMLAADNVVPVVTTELGEVDEVGQLADMVSASLTTEGLTELNRRFDVDVEDADAIARSHLEDAGLL